MKIAIVNNGVVGAIGNYWDLFPNTSFPPSGPNDAFLQEQSAMTVLESLTYDASTEKLEACEPYVDGAFVAVVRVVPLTVEDLNTLEANKKAAVKNDIIQQTQARLDVFAMTRNYDNILSACTYATSPTAKFATEGQYCVEQRDATWAKLLEILADVEAGTRPVPTGYAEIEPQLPPLVWPN